MIDPGQVLAVLNMVALLAFVALLGAGLFGLLRRLGLYMTAKEPVPVLLRRDIVLLVALAIVGLEAIGLRALGIAQLEGWVRVVFVFQQDVIVLGAILYWVRVELFDVDDPTVK